MIGMFDFPEAPQLLRQALPVAQRIARLKARARAAGAPVIYANDNYGQWRSDFRQVVERCAAPGMPGAEIVETLRPDPEDYFVLKPMQSGFYQTPLQALLQALDTKTLVITGIAGDACVLATATDAHMRHYDVILASDCTASPTPARNRRALQLARDTMQLDVRIGARVRF